MKKLLSNSRFVDYLMLGGFMIVFLFGIAAVVAAMIDNA